ncbi:MAG: hypothetical protein ACE5JJ_07800 [Nitrospinota bacterium]
MERPAERVALLLRHRKRREEQVLGLLGAGVANLAEMARTLYRDLDARRLRAAERMVRGHLEKLREEGKVVARREGEASRYRLA